MTDVESLAQTINNSRPEVFRSNLHEFACVLVFTFAVACTLISVGLFQISLNELLDHFSVNGGRLTWSVLSLNLANGALLLLAGRISDIIGRRRCVWAGFGAFLVFALVGGFMKSFVAVVVLRALMGASVAFCVPASGGILGLVYPVSIRKNRVMACYAAGAPIGFCTGIVAGGICAEYLSWRATHFFLAIVYGFLTVIAFYVVPMDQEKRQIRKELQNLDFIGAFLATAGLTLVLFALTQSGVPVEAWKTGYIIATMIVGGVLLILFVLYESYIPTNPLMPMFIWKNKDFLVAMLTVLLSWMCFQGVLTYFAILYYEQILNYSPLHTTACVTPMAVFGVMINLIAAFILHIVPGRVILVFALGLFLASALLWATMLQHDNYWRGQFEAFCFAVMGADFMFNVTNMVTVNAVPRLYQGTAQGIFQTVIQLLTALGLALSTTIVTQKFPAFATGVDLLDEEQVKQLFHSFKYAYYFAIGVAALGTVLSIFVKIGTSGTKDAAEKKAEYDKKIATCD